MEKIQPTLLLNKIFGYFSLQAQRGLEGANFYQVKFRVFFLMSCFPHWDTQITIQTYLANFVALRKA